MVGGKEGEREKEGAEGRQEEREGKNFPCRAEGGGCKKKLGS